MSLTLAQFPRVRKVNSNQGLIDIRLPTGESNLRAVAKKPVTLKGGRSKFHFWSSPAPDLSLLLYQLNQLHPVARHLIFILVGCAAPQSHGPYQLPAPGVHDLRRHIEANHCRSRFDNPARSRRFRDFTSLHLESLCMPLTEDIRFFSTERWQVC